MIFVIMVAFVHLCFALLCGSGMAKQAPFLGMNLPVELVTDVNKPPFPRVNVVMEAPSSVGTDAVRHARWAADEKHKESEHAFNSYKRSVQKVMMEEEARFREAQRLRKVAS